MTGEAGSECLVDQSRTSSMKWGGGGGKSLSIRTNFF